MEWEALLSGLIDPLAFVPVLNVDPFCVGAGVGYQLSSRSDFVYFGSLERVFFFFFFFSVMDFSSFRHHFLGHHHHNAVKNLME